MINNGDNITRADKAIRISKKRLVNIYIQHYSELIRPQDNVNFI